MSGHSFGAVKVYPFETARPYADVSEVWLDRAERTRERDRAIRFAVFSLLHNPLNLGALDFFESRLHKRLLKSRRSDTTPLEHLGRCLRDCGFTHYAAQVFRRATRLDPGNVASWRGLAVVTHSALERRVSRRRAEAHDPAGVGLQRIGRLARTRPSKRPPLIFPQERANSGEPKHQSNTASESVTAVVMPKRMSNARV